MTRRWSAAVGPWMAAAAPLAAQAPTPPTEEDRILQGMLALMNTPVVSASRTREKLSDAPATVIVLRAEDLEARGYRELSQILDDLPGMQVTRPYGDTWVKSYWRGYRNTIGEPFLVMVDGMVLNHLWFNTADVPLAALPLANIERVEVVYGPASSVYGANAFMGVINVITATEGDRRGRVSLARGAFASRTVDLHLLQALGGARISVAFRADRGDIDGSAQGRYEFLSDRYYADRRLFGRLLDFHPGRLTSEHRTTGLDLRVWVGSLEFGIHHVNLRSGYGLEYAADHYLPGASIWERPEWSFHVRTGGDLGPRATWTAMVRYRRSDTAKDSFDNEIYFDKAAGGFLTIPEHWTALNGSLAYTHEVDVQVSEAVSLNAGLKVEEKVLQKGYDWSNPDFIGIPVERYDPGNLGAYGQRSATTLSDGNHFALQEHGAYLQARWRLGPAHILNLGGRYDHNGLYGAANTLRAGYVSHLGPWGVKVLFGQAYQEPTARQLYGGWSGSGSNARLGPERSTTLEAAGTYTTRNLGVNLGLWQAENRGTIVTAPGGARNLGARNVAGVDLGLQGYLPGATRWRVWGYASHLFHARESSVDPATGAPRPEVRVGDLATTSLWVGATVDLPGRLTGTVRGRVIGARPTVATNPVGRVGGFTTLDLNLVARDLFVPGLGLALALENAGDARYAHPGVREGDAGLGPGAFVGGVWHGSAGYYSSLLPQPGRALRVTWSYRF